MKKALDDVIKQYVDNVEVSNKAQEVLLQDKEKAVTNAAFEAAKEAFGEYWNMMNVWTNIDPKDTKWKIALHGEAWEVTFYIGQSKNLELSPYKILCKHLKKHDKTYYWSIVLSLINYHRNETFRLPDEIKEFIVYCRYDYNEHVQQQAARLVRIEEDKQQEEDRRIEKAKLTEEYKIALHRWVNQHNDVYDRNKKTFETLQAKFPSSLDYFRLSYACSGDEDVIVDTVSVGLPSQDNSNYWTVFDNGVSTQKKFYYPISLERNLVATHDKDPHNVFGQKTVAEFFTLYYFFPVKDKYTALKRSLSNYEFIEYPEIPQEPRKIYGDKLRSAAYNALKCFT